MSRSRKKHPICGVAAASDKQDKRLANRRLRRKTKCLTQPQILSDEYILPVMREVSDVWAMAKDGKWRVDPEKYPKVLRK